MGPWPLAQHEQPHPQGRYLLRILVTISLTQGALGSRQIFLPCFVVALRGGRGESGVSAGLAGRGRGLGGGSRARTLT